MIPSKVFLFQFYPLLLLLPLLFVQSVSTIFPHKIPRLSPYNKEAFILRKSGQNSRDLKTYFYEQTLDHFNYAPQSFATFRQRYMVSFKHWGGPKSNSPIFAYLGAEEAIDIDLDIIGFPIDNAPYFKSLTIFIEVIFKFPFIYSTSKSLMYHVYVSYDFHSCFQ